MHRFLPRDRWVPHGGYISPQGMVPIGTPVVWHPQGHHGSFNTVPQYAGRKDQARYQQHLAALHTDVSRSSAELERFVQSNGWSGWEEDYDDLFGDDFDDLFGDDFDDFGMDDSYGASDRALDRRAAKAHRKSERESLRAVKKAMRVENRGEFRPFKIVSDFFKRGPDGKSQAEKIVEAAQVTADPPAFVMAPPMLPPPPPSPEKNTGKTVAIVAGSVAALAVVGVIGYKIASR